MMFSNISRLAWWENCPSTVVVCVTKVALPLWSYVQFYKEKERYTGDQICPTKAALCEFYFIRMTIRHESSGRSLTGEPSVMIIVKIESKIDREKKFAFTRLFLT